jgi:hypothetical protein
VARKAAKLATVNRPSSGRGRRLTAALALVLLAAGIGYTALRPSGKPTRAAIIVGAHAANFTAADTTIGPLQDQRIFYPTTLPASFIGSAGDRLPAGVTAVISYKTASINVVSFVRSIPADRPVIMIFHAEPEHSYGARGATFVAQFESQSNLIRSVHRANVRIAMAAEAYEYVDGRDGVSGSYLPPAGYVDTYLLDYYEPVPTAKGIAKNRKFQAWYRLVKNRGKPLGFAEYGLSSNGTAAGNARRVATLKADNAWISAHGPFAIWSYWWQDPATTTGKDNWQFTDPGAIAEWHAIEDAHG